MFGHCFRLMIACGPQNGVCLSVQGFQPAVQLLHLHSLPDPIVSISGIVLCGAMDTWHVEGVKQGTVSSAAAPPSQLRSSSANCC